MPCKAGRDALRRRPGATRVQGLSHETVEAWRGSAPRPVGPVRGPPFFLKSGARRLWPGKAVGMYRRPSYTHGRGAIAGIRLDFTAMRADRPFVPFARLYPQENEDLGVSRRKRLRSLGARPSFVRGLATARTR